MRQSLEDRVSEGQDIIDPRDVRERIGELEEERDAAAEEATQCDHGDCRAQDVHRADSLVMWEDTPEGEELARLVKLAEAMGYDEALISDSYFEEYARQTAEDIHGALNGQWPYTSIDWARAAEELQQDYASVTHGTTDYWQRS